MSRWYGEAIPLLPCNKEPDKEQTCLVIQGYAWNRAEGRRGLDDKELVGIKKRLQANIHLRTIVDIKTAAITIKEIFGA